MLRKINLASAAFAVAVILLSVGDAKALAVFTVGGVKMICHTCTCAEMADAGVPLEHCVNTALISPNAPKVYDKIIRYSASDVRLGSPDGKEFPLSSDAAQKQFEEISGQRNFRQLVGRLRPTAGAISQERVERLARDLGVEVVDNRDGGDEGQGEQSLRKPVLVRIRNGELLALKSFKQSERERPSGDVYKAQASLREGKLVLQFDRPLSRESKMELKAGSAVVLDEETSNELGGACSCQAGTFAVEKADSRNPSVAIPVVRVKPSPQGRKKYVVDKCPDWGHHGRIKSWFY